jgi:hydroxyquinol 1,2-dioxygenase
MRNIDENTITPAVLQAMAGSAGTRLHTVMTALVTHLHDFAREVKLTEDEWFQAIQFLTAAGHITDENRQEFILLSDVLGLSMLVTTQNNRKPEACTQSTVLGPFFVPGAPRFDNGDDIANGSPGAPCFVRGRVRGLDGKPVAQALVDVWQSDEEGGYDVQTPGPDGGPPVMRARGTLHSLPDGQFHFRSILAEAYPIPHDGPVGGLLQGLARHPWRPAHLHFRIEAPGFQTLVTHLFRDNGQYLDSDVVFGVRNSLVVDWVRHPAGTAPDGTRMEQDFYTLDYDFVLNPTLPA